MNFWRHLNPLTKCFILGLTVCGPIFWAFILFLSVALEIYK
jgi:hypothetical protein